MPTRSSLIFLLVGVLINLGAGLWAFKTYSFIEAGIKVDAEVVEVIARRGSKNTTYVPVFKYQYQNKTFTERSHISSSPPSFEVGDKSVLALNPNDPTDFFSDSLMERWAMPFFISFFGDVFFLIGGLGLLNHRRRQKQRAYLDQRGMRIQAKVMSVEVHAMLKVNGKSPWRVTAQAVHPLDGKLTEFRSDNLWENPAPYLGDEVEVRIDPQNSELYYIVIPVHSYGRRAA